VLIAGGGVAAVEAILALRHLAGREVAIELLTPGTVMVDRPASVATPFGLGGGPALDVLEFARRHDVALRHGELASVDAGARSVRTLGGEELAYDFLLIAVGARPVRALPGAITFRGPADTGALEGLLDRAAERAGHRITFAVSPETAWPLPAYELAVMTAIELLDRGAKSTELTVVTPEPEPLWLFGGVAAGALRELLAARGIALRTGERPVAVRYGALALESGDVIATDAVVALPRLVGPHVRGLPADAAGFIPTDAHGRVPDAPGVLAAGDATTFPVKQGGLATQQADAAAAAIAAEIGAIDDPAPFTPVLRGLLLTGGAPLYLRAELGRSGEPRSAFASARRLHGEVSSRALWWPPGKIAGRYLAPYLATARPADVGAEPLLDRRG
jgi:sulfide:quinone oxidoreductase